METSRSHLEKMRGNGHKLLLGTQLDTRGQLSTMRTISHWNDLLRKTLDSPTLDTLKVQEDRVLGHLV